MLAGKPSFNWKMYNLRKLNLECLNPDRNIFSINVELTSTFLLYRGLVHHHHQISKDHNFMYIKHYI